MVTGKKSKWTIRDAVESADLFIQEAKWCADNGMGYAALMTVFPVMLAIGESIARFSGNNNPSTEDSFAMIFPFMREDWYVAVENHLPELDFESLEEVDFEKQMLEDELVTTQRREILTKLLVDVRNGLVHALSLPTQVSNRSGFGLPSLHVCLLDSEELFHQGFSDSYQIAIIPSRLVDAISQAIHQLDGITLQEPHDAQRGKKRSLTGIDWGGSTAASGIKIPKQG